MREKPKVIDLTRKIGTVETLTEARINCTLEEKVTHSRRDGDGKVERLCIKLELLDQLYNREVCNIQDSCWCWNKDKIDMDVRD